MDFLSAFLLLIEACGALPGFVRGPPGYLFQDVGLATSILLIDPGLITAQQGASPPSSLIRDWGSDGSGRTDEV